MISKPVAGRVTIFEMDKNVSALVAGWWWT